MAIEGMCYAQVGYLQTTFLKGTTVHFLKPDIHSVLLYLPMTEHLTAKYKALRYSSAVPDSCFRILTLMSCTAASQPAQDQSPSLNTLLSKIIVYS